MSVHAMDTEMLIGRVSLFETRSDFQVEAS